MLKLNGLENDIDIVFKELKGYTANFKSIAERMKVVIGNDLGRCKRAGCDADKPCDICKQLYVLDEEINNLLE